MPVKYERVDRELVHEIFTRHVLGGQPCLDHVLDGPLRWLARYEILLCGSMRCGWQGDKDFVTLLKEKLKAADLGEQQVRLTAASCFGACNTAEAGQFSHILVRPDKVLYRIKDEADLDEIIREHLLGGKMFERLRVAGKTIGRKFFELYGDVSFFNRQSRIALRHNGVVDPESIEEYIHYSGFQALAKVLAQDDRQWVIKELIESKLRGRGGGGFATGQKCAWPASRRRRPAT